MTQILERPADGNSARGQERQVRHAERRQKPAQGARFFVSWHDDPLVFNSSADSVDGAALEFVQLENQFEREGVPMTIEALEGLYGDRPVVVWEMPQEGTALVDALWFREGELEPVDAITRARVTYWMQERLARPQLNAQNRSWWLVGALAVAAIGLTALWPLLQRAS